MRRIIFASYPRSGHHITEKVLKRYFELSNLKYSYCTNMQKCFNIPCSCNHQALITKTHLFRQDEEKVIQENKHFVLFLLRKDDLKSVESYTRCVINFSKNQTKQISYEKSRNPLDLTNETVLNTLKNMNKYLNKFKKLVEISRNKEIFYYEDMIENPKLFMTKLLKNVFNLNVNQSILKQVLDEIIIENKYHNENKSYFNEIKKILSNPI